jgi:hypothetical protein
MSFLNKLIEIFSGYGEPLAEANMIVFPKEANYKCYFNYSNKFHLFALVSLYLVKIRWLFLVGKEFYTDFLNDNFLELINNNFKIDYLEIESRIIKKIESSDTSYYLDILDYYLIKKRPEKIKYEIKLYNANSQFTTFNSWSPGSIQEFELLIHYFLFLKEVYSILNVNEKEIFKILLQTLMNNKFLRITDPSPFALQGYRLATNILLMGFESLIKEEIEKAKDK